MALRIGFLTNPIAGMGGAVGLKGTDGVVAQALQRGASPRAPPRALEALQAILLQVARDSPTDRPLWVTASGQMGAQLLAQAGVPPAEVEEVYQPADPTSAADTRSAVEAFVAAGVALVLFCGGDGTARDVVSVCGTRVPVLGIPAGVKMYSGVFGVTPAAVGTIVVDVLTSRIGTAEVEVLDLDEEAYRAGEWKVRLFQVARTPFEPTLVQMGKMLVEEIAEEEIRHGIGVDVAEQIRDDPSVLWLLGPGSTVAEVARALGIEHTLLGIDAICDGKRVGTDLGEEQLLALVGRYARTKVVVSPIGAQGFILGRGNLQLSPAVLRAVGLSNLVVLATPAKLARTPTLRVDTGDRQLDSQLAAKGSILVVIAERTMRLVPLQVVGSEGEPPA